MGLKDKHKNALNMELNFNNTWTSQLLPNETQYCITTMQYVITDSSSVALKKVPSSIKYWV